MIALIEEGQAEIRMSLDKGLKSITHIDRSIDYVVKSVQEERKKDKVLQVGF